MRLLMALTIGLLAFLAIDAVARGHRDRPASGSQAFGGAELLFLGAAAAYLALSGSTAVMRERQRARRGKAGSRRPTCALLVAIGIGLHNLGEGLAIGSAYAIGALALGAFLVVGFAIHNTTEGLAIVAPLAKRAARRSAASPASA